ncbi:MAG: RDD family protein [bacterium]
MFPTFEKRVRGFSIDTSLTFLLILLLIGLPFSTTLRQILLVVIMIGVYLVPYIFSPGQTFGKRIQKTKVVNSDMTDANLFKLIFRDMFKVILSIATGGLYLIVCVFVMDEKSQNKALHDKLFKTTVIDLNTRKTYKDDYLNKPQSLRKRGVE